MYIYLTDISNSDCSMDVREEQSENGDDIKK